ncbi:hypothetical protein [Nocardioides sp. CCNWLW212]|uniref:hypothetical protein n=1 Tax=Nocardioides sp. CCNWLW212 TaxID=3128897 RepID=UPI00307EFF15
MSGRPASGPSEDHHQGRSTARSGPDAGVGSSGVTSTTVGPNARRPASYDAPPVTSTGRPGSAGQGDQGIPKRSSTCRACSSAYPAAAGTGTTTR